MRVGIITFHRAVNYGAVLQAFALCRAIRDLGHDCEIIDYRCRFIEDYYDQKCLIKLKNWKRLFSYLINNGNLNPDKEQYYSFLKDNNVIGDKIYLTNTALKETNDLYDCFVTGSDQVWNYSTAGFDKSYFLDFVEESKKKKSYAASFGFSQIPESYISEYERLLRDYSVISVRETTGKSIINSILDTLTTVDLDPTLLVQREEWANIASTSVYSSDNRKKGYVLVYMIGEDKRLLRSAKEIAQKKNLDVLYISDRWKKRMGVYNLRSVQPQDWLCLIMNADYIITNSFHGTAFSVNFNKRFVVLGNKESQKKASRIETLLTDLEISDRITYDVDQMLAVIDSDIPFDILNINLEKRRQESISNLRKELSGGTQDDNQIKERSQRCLENASY